MPWLSGSKNSNPSLTGYSLQAQMVRFAPCAVRMHVVLKKLDAAAWYLSGTEAS